MNKKDDIVLGANEDPQRKKKYNIIPKVISAVLAFILWFYVMSVESPVNEKVFYSVPIELKTGDLAPYSGLNATVDITVRGKRSDLNQISDDDIKVVADASNYTQSGKNTIPLTIDVPDNVTLVEKSKDSLSVYLGTKESASVEVDIKYSNYTMGEGLEFGSDNEVKKNPQEIYLSGPGNALKNVKMARVVVDCGGAVTSSFSGWGEVQLIDMNGEVIPEEDITANHITVDPETVDVKVPVFTAKEIGLKVDFKNGTLNSSNCDVQINPSEITVRGKVEEISKLDEHIFYTVNEEELTSDSFSVPLSLPEGFKCTDGTESVDITIVRKEIPVTDPDEPEVKDPEG